MHTVERQRDQTTLLVMKLRRIIMGGVKFRVFLLRGGVGEWSNMITDYFRRVKRWMLALMGSDKVGSCRWTPIRF